MKKQIWLFHHYADPPGGTWLGSHEQYKHLVDYGNLVTIFTSNYNHYSRDNLEDLEGKSYKIKFVEGIRYVLVKTHPYKKNGINRLLNMISYAINTYRAAKKLNDPPDIVIATTPHPFSVFAGLLFAKIRKKKFVIELHDLWTEYIFDSSKSIPAKILVFFLRRFDTYMYKRADYIFYLWLHMDKYLVEMGCDKDKLKWTPLGVDKFNDLNKSDQREKKFTITCTARFGPASNIMEILRSAKIIADKNGQNIEFIIAGDGPEKNNLQNFCNENKLDNVKFPGMIKKSEIPELLSVSDVLIGTLPSIRHYNIYGTIPTKIIDYLAAGKPTIFISGIKNNILDLSKAGFSILPGEIDKIAETILFLKNIPFNKYSEYGKNGVNFVKKNHYLPQLARNIDNYLNELFV